MMNVMKKAWELAKEAVKNFGGKAKQYISEALKEAWKIIKNGVVEMKREHGFKVSEIKKGTEKQISWAEDIRTASLEMLDVFEETEIFANWVKHTSTTYEEAKEDFEVKIKKFARLMHGFNDAAMIIERGKFLTSKFLTVDEKVKKIFF